MGKKLLLLLLFVLLPALSMSADQYGGQFYKMNSKPRKASIEFKIFSHGVTQARRDLKSGYSTEDEYFSTVKDEYVQFFSDQSQRDMDEMNVAVSYLNKKRDKESDDRIAVRYDDVLVAALDPVKTCKENSSGSFNGNYLHKVAIDGSNDMYHAKWNFGKTKIAQGYKELKNYTSKDLKVIEDTIRRVPFVRGAGGDGSGFFTSCKKVVSAKHVLYNVKGGEQNTSMPRSVQGVDIGLYMIKDKIKPRKDKLITFSEADHRKNINTSNYRKEDFESVTLNKSHPYFSKKACSKMKSRKLPVKYVRQMKGELPGFVPPKKCFVVGYSSDMYLTKRPSVDLRDPDQPRNYVSHSNHVNAKSISFCSFLEFNEEYHRIEHKCDLLEGASGGPLMCQFEDKNWYHAGVISYFDRNGTSLAASTIHNPTKVRFGINYSSIPGVRYQEE